MTASFSESRSHEILEAAVAHSKAKGEKRPPPIWFAQGTVMLMVLFNQLPPKEAEQARKTLFTLAAQGFPEIFEGPGNDCPLKDATLAFVGDVKDVRAGRMAYDPDRDGPLPL